MLNHYSIFLFFSFLLFTSFRPPWPSIIMRSASRAFTRASARASRPRSGKTFVVCRFLVCCCFPPVAMIIITSRENNRRRCSSAGGSSGAATQVRPARLVRIGGAGTRQTLETDSAASSIGFVWHTLGPGRTGSSPASRNVFAATFRGTKRCFGGTVGRRTGRTSRLRVCADPRGKLGAFFCAPATCLLTDASERQDVFLDHGGSSII